MPDTGSSYAKKDWEKYVANSNGTAIFIPSKLKTEAEAVEKKRKEFNKFLMEVSAKTELELSTETQILFMKIRQALADNGQPDIWGKELGWNQDALKDGVLIIHVLDQNK